MNIHHAALEAMSRAFTSLREKAILEQPVEVVVDGRFCPDLDDPVSGEAPSGECRSIAVRALVGGDREVPEVMAASIVAKVWRDRWMQRYGEWDCRYGFASHKGYPTAGHRRALSDHGACPIHRRTFRGVLHADSVPSA